MHNQSQTLTLLILKDKIENNSGNDGNNKKEDTNLDPILINFLFNLINIPNMKSMNLISFIFDITNSSISNSKLSDNINSWILFLIS